MINVTFAFKQNIFLFGLYILVDFKLGLIDQYIIGPLVGVFKVGYPDFGYPKFRISENFG